MSTTLTAGSLSPLMLPPRRRQRVKFRDARPRLRMGIRRALNSGRVTGAQADALREALDDDDLLEEAYYRARTELPEEPAPGRDWSGFFGALAKFIEALAPIVMAILKMFMGSGVPALAVPAGRALKAMQRKFAAHPDGLTLHAMATDLVGTFRVAHFDFDDSAFQSAWRLFSNAVHSTLEAFDPEAIDDVVTAMGELEDAFNEYDGPADSIRVVFAIGNFLQASFQLFGA